MLLFLRVQRLRKTLFLGLDKKSKYRIIERVLAIGMRRVRVSKVSWIIVIATTTYNSC